MQKVIFAKFNNCLMSAQKVRLVGNLIRGKSALEAKDILRFTNKAAAKDCLKTLDSAIANCVHNEGYNKKDLYVALVNIDEAPSYKRGRATARGRYHQIIKRNCNIKIGLVNGPVEKNLLTKKIKGEVKKEIEAKSSKKEIKEVKEVAKKSDVKSTKKKVTKNLSKKEVKK